MKTTPIVLFDGGCGFCGGAVRLVLRHDTGRVFRFAPLDSAVGQQYLAEHGLAADPGTVVLIDGGRAAVRSDAVLGIVRRLGGWWHLLRMGALVPRPLRDLGYDWVARHRGRLGGALGSRPIEPGERAGDNRFLA